MLIKNNDLHSLFEGESNFIANASNFTAYVYHSFEHLNWVGFYLFDGSELVLGPFQGKTACIRIPLGKGVCGTAAIEKRTILVDNVHDFEGHIACDSASNSEIVIPIIVNDKLFGVLDIDSPKLNRFSNEDKILFESFIEVLIDSSDMESITNYYSNNFS